MACKLVSLRVVQHATQRNVTGAKNWATVKKTNDPVVVEAITEPNTENCWKQIVWRDAGDPVPGKPNQRKLSRMASKRYHVEAELGGVSDYLDVWILWATVDIKTEGPRPRNAAPFDSGTRDNTQNLGAVTYESIISSVIDEKADVFVTNMGASGKVAPVATLTPKGVHRVIEAGWSFLRQVWSHNWSDGKKLDPGNQRGNSWNTAWVDDTSKTSYLRLTPDASDRIYDLDAPDIRWGKKTYETYNNFRQWIEWNGQRCSDYAPWYYQARWQLHRDSNRQITLNQVGKGHIELPTRPKLR